MKDKFFKLNKQIASFMLVTFALAGLTTAAENTTRSDDKTSPLSNNANKIEIPETFSENDREMPIIAMYAAPEIPVKIPQEKIYPKPQNEQIMMRYAPPAYFKNKQPESEIIKKPQKQEMMLMYAAPEYFEKKIQQETTPQKSKWQKFLDKFKRDK